MPLPLGLPGVALGQLVQHLLNGSLALSSHRFDLPGQLRPLPIEGVADFGQNPETRIEDLPLLEFLDEGRGGPRPLRELLPGHPSLLAQRPRRLCGSQYLGSIRPGAGSNLRGIVPQQFEDGAILLSPQPEPVPVLVADRGHPEAGRHIEVPNFPPAGRFCRRGEVLMGGGVPPHPRDEIAVPDLAETTKPWICGVFRSEKGRNSNRDRRHHKPELYQLSYCHLAAGDSRRRRRSRRSCWARR
jgi:hypothetical protein